jgi:hypothetical protein
MSQLDADHVSRYIQDYGWSFTSQDESTWITGWQSEKRAYPLIIELCDTWVRFVVRPIIKLDIEWVQWPDVMRFILELNQSCRLVRLSIEDDGSLSLSLDCLSRDFTYEHFSDALGIIGYYAEHLFELILSHIMHQGILPGYQSRMLV